MLERSAGILLPVSSLPSPYGIGTLGREAYRFADFLKKAGQRYWQILPLGPTSYGDSPYQSFSTFAGNPYLIDLDLLVKDGLLKRSEIASRVWGGDPSRVDYAALHENRLAVLAIAKRRGWERDRDAVRRFQRKNAAWLGDYALYMALKRHFGMRSWQQWDDEAARLREDTALRRYRRLLREDIELFIYVQFLFYRQWDALRAYLHGLGILVIGDLPIYVAMDSADVWASPQLFRLDRRGFPKEVAGVPPDYFNEDGQLWGNPIYNYRAMEKDGYAWWIARVAGASRLYDVLRLDHFRAFASYWTVKYGSPTARVGKWVKGPGMKLLGVLKEKFPDLQFIAEDLGELTPDVHRLRKRSGLPGMKVLEFAFTPGEESDYLPHRYTPHCACYTGTHDNPPLALWRREEPEKAAYAARYFGLSPDDDFARGVIRGGMGSAAVLFVAQMQDYLGLTEGSRVNMPGIPDGNWQWRMLPGAASAQLAREIRKLTKQSGRLPT